MGDFGFVTSRLATGAAITGPADVQARASASITHIIDCRDDFYDAPLLASDTATSYLWNGVPDDGDTATHGDTWFGKSLRFGLPALSSPHVRLYCPCAAGINRGPWTAFAIILASEFTASGAESIIARHGPLWVSRTRWRPLPSAISFGYS